jgi:hypothetical protein
MGEPLREDQEVLLLNGQLVVVGRQESPDVGEPVLLGRHRAAVGVGEHLAGDVSSRTVRESLLALLDEERVLRESTGVQIERDVMLSADLRDGPYVGHRDGLAPARVVGDGQHAHGDPLRAHFVDQRPEGTDVHVAFEGVGLGGHETLGNGKVSRLRPRRLDVRSSRVEMRVVGHHVAGSTDGGEEDPLGRAALVRGDHVLEAEDLAHGALETVPRPTPRVRFVSPHHRSPLFGTHGACSGVRQEIDEHVVRAELERVVARLDEVLAPLRTRRHPDRLDDLDTERLDDTAWGRAHASMPRLPGGSVHHRLPR